ncbi:hypothetical protein [Streptomyces sp. SID3343]|uniref:hypothetical protein n=1 Tax=Streptomyces sp. SID3343 TaxID=2690260 RepID=UPI001367F375|nr:hypothetical protein [Streptomyces sp. SID3343]MYW06038.1 hypothetical protein [Streptomyces sp. SID3343]
MPEFDRTHWRRVMAEGAADACIRSAEIHEAHAVLLRISDPRASTEHRADAARRRADAAAYLTADGGAR